MEAASAANPAFREESEKEREKERRWKSGMRISVEPFPFFPGREELNREFFGACKVADPSHLS